MPSADDDVREDLDLDDELSDDEEDEADDDSDKEDEADLRTLFFATVLCVLVLSTLLFRSSFVCAFPFAFDLSVRAFAARGIDL